MRKSVLSLILPLALLLLISPTGSDPGGGQGAEQGEIVFESMRDGRVELYAMRADGTGLRRVTDNSALDEYPAWSPEGTRIAFQSDRDGDEETYVMDTEGGEPVRLTDNEEPDQFPKWRR